MDRLIEQIVKWRPFKHIAYWVLLILFFGFFWGSDEGYYRNFLFSEAILMPTKMVMVYWTIYYIIPQFLFTKRYTELLLIFSASLAITAIILRLQAYYILIPLWGMYSTEHETLSIYRIVQFAADTNTVMVIPLAYTLVKEWLKKQIESHELAQQRTTAELQLLQNQIHPHFLFNSLNSLYSLVLKKSDQAPDMLLKLSSLMRYQLQEANSEKVSLQKEIEYLQNYIALEKMRYGKRFELHFATNGNWDKLQITPLLLLPFIENAFKHGVSGAIVPAWLRIEITVTKRKVHLLVENSIALANEQNLVSGIGLKNVRRRLALSYPNKYQLTTKNDKDSYLAILKIELD